MLYQHSLALAERTQVRAALVDVLLSQADFENAWQALDDGSPPLPLLVRRLVRSSKVRLRSFCVGQLPSVASLVSLRCSGVAMIRRRNFDEFRHCLHPLGFRHSAISLRIDRPTRFQNLG